MKGLDPEAGTACGALGGGEGEMDRGMWVWRTCDWDGGMSRQGGVIWRNAVTFTVSSFFGQVQWMNEEFVTKVTPTVTNVTRASIDEQHKDLTQSVKDRCRHLVLCLLYRHTVIHLQKHTDNISVNMYSFICSRKCWRHVISLGLQSANHLCAIWETKVTNSSLLFIFPLLQLSTDSSCLESCTKYWWERDTESSVHLCLTSWKSSSFFFYTWCTYLCVRLCLLPVNRRYWIGELNAWLNENCRILVIVCSRVPPPRVPSH